MVPCAGPMYCKYNAVLRDFPQAVVDDLRGNKYATTIHLIVSGVIKLSKCVPLIAPRVVCCMSRGSSNASGCDLHVCGHTSGARNRVDLSV